MRFEMGKEYRGASSIFVDVIPEKTTTTRFTSVHVNLLRKFLNEQCCFCKTSTCTRSVRYVELRKGFKHDPMHCPCYDFAFKSANQIWKNYGIHPGWLRYQRAEEIRMTCTEECHEQVKDGFEKGVEDADREGEDCAKYV